MGDLRSCYGWSKAYTVIFVQSFLLISAFSSVKRKCYKIFKLSFRMACLSLESSSAIVPEWVLGKAGSHGSLKMGCVGKEFSLCPDCTDGC